MNPSDIKIADYDYHLPDHKIAKYPLELRHLSKLLVYKNNQITDSQFRNIKDHLPEGSLILFNDSKVIPVRFKFPISEDKVIEIFCLESVDNSFDKKSQWKCFVGKVNKWKEGLLTLNKDDKTISVRLIEKNIGSCIVEFSWNDSIHSMQEVFEIFGSVPIPPYLKRKSEAVDTERYQTVFAHADGSVAAPTAGLHFTNEIIEELKENNFSIEFVTLHVGAGTFKPVSTETLGGHDMHLERMLVSAELIDKLIQQIEEAKPITTVGTTSLRTIESIYWLGHKLSKNPELKMDEMNVTQWEPYESNDLTSPIQALQSIKKWLEINSMQSLAFTTEVLILPSYQFKFTDCIVTNFHQPKSTLLLLVAAVTANNWNKIYSHALQHDYRFLSYGDSSILYIHR